MGKKNNSKKSKKPSQKAKSTSSKSAPGPRSSSYIRPFNESGSFRGPSTPTFRSSGKDILSVSGCELVDTLTAQPNFTSYTFNLSPITPFLFPRLEAFALVFEKFRVGKFKVVYVPACPSTRSGSIAMMIDYDASDPAPPDFKTILNNVTSVTCPIGSSCSMSYIPRSQSQTWFYINSSNSDAADQRLNYPGVITIATDYSTGSDIGLIGGFVYIDYEIHFTDIKPVPQVLTTRVSKTVGTDLSYQATPTPATNFFDLSSILSQLGSFGDSSTNNASQPVPGTTVSTAQSILLDVGAYALDYFWSVGAEGGTSSSSNSSVCSSSSSSCKGELIKPRLVRHPVMDEIKFDEKYVHVRSENKGLVRLGTQYISVWQDPRTGQWWGELSDGQWVLIPPDPPTRKKRSDIATGDFSTYLQLRDAVSGTSTTIDTVTDTGSTAALTYNKVLPVTLSKPAYLSLYYLLDEMGDTRFLRSLEMNVVNLAIS